MLPTRRSDTTQGTGRRNQVLVSSLAEALRWDITLPLNVWAERLVVSLPRLYPQLGILQVALYENQPVAQRFVLLAGYALNPETPETLPWGHGLLGQQARDPRAHFLNQTPQVRAYARTTLVAIRSKGWAVLPLLYQEHLVGLLELSCLNSFRTGDEQALQDLVQQIAATLDNIQNQIKIQYLLEESEKRNLELEKRERELEYKILEQRETQRELEELQAKLVEANATLEAQVKARTRELETALAKVEAAQDQIVLSEKMAALGQLVAGVAHEINSPLGAVKASANIISENLPIFIRTLPVVMLGLEGDILLQLLAFIDTLLTEKPVYLSPTEERKLRRRYIKQLESHNAPEAEEIALAIVGAGYQGELDSFMDIFVSQNAAEIAQLLYYIGQLKVNIENIDLAADKTKKVVFALKSYAHSDGHNVVSEVHIQENLDTVLTIYQNQLKYGIKLTTDLQPVKTFAGYPDELSQVWTNLIQNAIQAMQGEGNLDIQVRETNNGAEVRIIDSGSGIPPDIQQKIFMPFFTTKKRGEGTGLGLDICKKIVEKHLGTISVESRPGRTCFTVWLPYNNGLQKS